MSAKNKLENKRKRRQERERKDAERSKQQLVARVQAASMVSDYLNSMEIEEGK